jgi:hypothetical protein
MRSCLPRWGSELHCAEHKLLLEGFFFRPGTAVAHGYKGEFRPVRAYRCPKSSAGVLAQLRMHYWEFRSLLRSRNKREGQMTKIFRFFLEI